MNISFGQYIIWLNRPLYYIIHYYTCVYTKITHIQYMYIEESEINEMTIQNYIDICVCIMQLVFVLR